MRTRFRQMIGTALCAGAAALAGCRARPDVRPRDPASPVATAAQDTVVAITISTTTDTLAGEEVEPDRDPSDRCRYADARRQARPGDTNYGTPYDTVAMSRGVTLRCALREGGPEARVMVLGGWGIPMAVDVYVPATASRRTQRLFITDNDERAYEGSSLAHGIDLNRDGWTDLKVQTWSGSAGISYALFMYDPARRRFVQDSVLPGGGGIVPIAGSGEPCVGTGQRMGAGNFHDVDYCWRGGRWVAVRETRQERLGDMSGGRYVLTVREPRGGRMVTVRVDTSTTDAAAKP
ncbi:MAG TPA: hypothetical protein VM890_08395 [Longimicrobium sp.]|jgi:hypothetical protein|nr:hypothetical protein [Longimicrobium sp.]